MRSTQLTRTALALLLTFSQCNSWAIVRIPGPGGATAGGGGGPTQIGSTQCASGLGGGTTSGFDTSTAKLYVIIVSAALDPLGTITSSPSQTWNPLTIQSNAGANIQRLFYVSNPTTNSSQTVSTSATAATICFEAWDTVTQIDTGTPNPTENGASSGLSSVTTIQTGSITPSANSNLVISGLSFAASGTVSVNSSLTIGNQVDFQGGDHYGGAIAHLVQNPAAAINPTWTATSSTLNATIAAFKP